MTTLYEVWIPPRDDDEYPSNGYIRGGRIGLYTKATACEVAEEWNQSFGVPIEVRRVVTTSIRRYDGDKI